MNKQKIEEIVEMIEDQLGLGAILDLLCNQSGGADRIEFWLDLQTSRVFVVELNTNTTVSFKDCKYLLNLKTWKGEYDFLWEGYASYCEDRDSWLTEEGHSFKTRRDLADHCLKDFPLWEEKEMIRENIKWKLQDV